MATTATEAHGESKEWGSGTWWSGSTDRNIITWSEVLDAPPEVLWSKLQTNYITVTFKFFP